VLAASDSWRSDAFAGATADEKKCPASASALRAVRMLVEIGVRFGLATTSSAARSGAGLGCCRRPGVALLALLVVASAGD